MVKGSLQQELDTFFQTLDGHEISAHQVTKAAFSKARQQLSSQTFVELNQDLLESVYKQAELKHWKRFRLCAVDGSKIRLIDTPAIRTHFGVQSNGTRGEDRPMALVSGYYDVLNDLMIDACIASMTIDERTLAVGHLTHSHEDDLILYDRGYPSFWLLALHQQKQRQFCVRVPVNFCREVDAFRRQGRIDQIIEWRPGKAARRLCRHHHVSDQPIMVRLVRVVLNSGEVEILMTSLLNQDTYPTNCFPELYHLRWGIEECYKRLKSRLEIENFSGKSVLCVEQDFHAKILAQNLTALMVLATHDAVKQKTNHRRYTYQINMTQALSRMKNTIALLLTKTHIHQLIKAVLDVIVTCLEPIRPGRKAKRNVKRRNRFNIAYKRAL